MNHLLKKQLDDNMIINTVILYSLRDIYAVLFKVIDSIVNYG